MYSTYFGFKRDPFGVEWDEDFLFKSPHWNSVYDGVCAQIKSKRGTALLTGDVGYGKTVMLRELEASMIPDTEFVYMKTRSYDYEEFLGELLENLNLATEDGSMVEKLQSLNQYLMENSGLHLVIAIDDIDSASPLLLKNILLLATRKNPEYASVQIILASLPEFRFQLSNMKPKPPGISSIVCFELDHLDKDEVGRYITHRLTQAGNSNINLFSEEAVAEISNLSEGIPAIIDLVCSKTLRKAEKLRTRQILGNMVCAESIASRPVRSETNSPADAVAGPREPGSADRDSYLRQISGQWSFLQLFSNRTLLVSLTGVAAFAVVYIVVIESGTTRTADLPPELTSKCENGKCVSYSGSVDLRSTDHNSGQFGSNTQTPPSELFELRRGNPDNQQQPAKHTDDHEMPPETTAATEHIANRPPPVSGPGNASVNPPSEPPDIGARAYLSGQGVNPDLDTIYEQAKAYDRQDANSDAYLLYFYLARKGHPEAAFRLATLNDPITFTRTPGLVDEPNFVQAYKWYRVASRSGHPDADRSLLELRKFIENQAGTGNQLAQLLILQWSQN